MRILLINPPRFNEIIGNNPSIIEEQRGYNPPLGLLYIAAFLEQNTDHKIKVIDAQVEKLDYSSLTLEISAFDPHVVGITAMTLTLIDVLIAADAVKKINKDIKVVLGGPHVNFYPEETIQHKSIDYLVLREGEVVFKELIDRIDDRSGFKKLSGIVYKKNGEIINTGIQPYIQDLDELPYPSRKLTPYKKYSSLLSKGKIVTTVFTSRGCPFNCSFCDRPSLGKEFRFRSAINVVNELEECNNLGISDFLFYDDTFTVKKKRVIDICNEILRRKLEIKWDIRARVDTIDEEMLVWLGKAGCQGIHYGVEAGTEKVLKMLNKNISISKVRTTFNLTRKYNMSILAYFMIGNPNETLNDILTTFRIMKSLAPDYIHLTILTPFPGTKVYFDGMQKGIIQKDYWREFAKNPRFDFLPPHWDEFFSKDELNKLLVKGYKSFYLRPSYIIKRITDLRSFGEFKKKAVAGFRVFNMT